MISKVQRITLLYAIRKHIRIKKALFKNLSGDISIILFQEANISHFGKRLRPILEPFLSFFVASYLEPCELIYSPAAFFDAGELKSIPTVFHTLDAFTQKGLTKVNIIMTLGKFRKNKRAIQENSTQSNEIKRR